MEGPEEDPSRLATVGYALRLSRRESQPPLYVATCCQAVEGPEEKPPTVWRQLATPLSHRIVNRNHSVYVATRCQAVEVPEEDPNRLVTVGYALRPTRRESQPLALCSHLLPSGGRSRGRPQPSGDSWLHP